MPLSQQPQTAGKTRKRKERLAESVTYNRVSSLICRLSFLVLRPFSSAWQSVDFANILRRLKGGILCFKLYLSLFSHFWFATPQEVLQAD